MAHIMVDESLGPLKDFGILWLAMGLAGVVLAWLWVGPVIGGPTVASAPSGSGLVGLIAPKFTKTIVQPSYTCSSEMA